MKLNRKVVIINELGLHARAAGRIAKLAEQASSEVYIAKDGEEGIKKARELKPDLIVLDLMLPNIGGVDVCKRIRNDDVISSTKIIMVTAKNHPKDELKGMNVGADDYIMKPFEADELMHVVSQVLNS